MDKSEYQRLHEEEVRELKLRCNTILKNRNSDYIVSGIVLGLVLFSVFNIGRDYGQSEKYNELKALKTQNRNLEEAIEKERTRYFIKGTLSGRK